MSETGNGMRKVVFQNVYRIMMNSCNQNRQSSEKQLNNFIRGQTLEMGYSMGKRFSQTVLPDHFERLQL